MRRRTWREAILAVATTVMVIASTVGISLATPTAVSAATTSATRLSGLTRYETAVAVSQTYPAPQPSAYIATGADFPDALSAAAAAAKTGGPVLLTSPNSIPAGVLTELKRLRPGIIYVVGGSGVVSDAVTSRLSTLAPVRRLAGPDRYQTSIGLVSTVFGRASRIMLATGRTYADALSAGAAGGSAKIPTLLVDGAKAALPTGTLAVLKQWGTTEIDLAGSIGAISLGIEQQLRASNFTVHRYGGDTRYETAAEINSAIFGSASPATIYLATGVDFPDALAAAARAGQANAPLYLTQHTCTPPVTHDAIGAAPDAELIVVGGTGVVGEAAAANLGCPGSVASTPAFATSDLTFSTSVAAPYSDRAPVNVYDPSIKLDSNNVVIYTRIDNRQRADHPVAYAQYGISALLEYQSTNNQVWLTRALAQANRLVVTHSERDDSWFYPYQFPWTYAGRSLTDPWWSAMAQGEALSLFVRLYEETGDSKWKEAADHTWTSLLVPRSPRQPWATFVDSTLAPHSLWFEEYVGNLEPLRVLNGHIFAVFGVYDYWKLTGDATALKYLNGASTSTLAVMPLIRVPHGVSYYCWQKTFCQQKNWQNTTYHVIHSWQLDTLARLTGDTRFSTWAQTLRSDWSPAMSNKLSISPYDLGAPGMLEPTPTMPTGNSVFSGQPGWPDGPPQ